MDDEWDLHAVVRSCANIPSANTTTIDDYDDGFDNMELVTSSDNVNSLYSYLNSCENASSEGLEDVYKEVCSIVTPLAPPLTTNAVYVDEEDELPAMDSFSIETPSRKRKNQQKKIVVELTQEELGSDTWQWRKYGQKPIKGSPFPRNYYKCSTIKECGARKQVERSHMDPTIFIVSYSGEHIHPRPTHRSPLAGSTRSNKFATPNIPPTTCDDTSHS